MIRLIVLCVILFVGNILETQAVGITKSIKEFGAKGDGKTNDTEAFNKASDFFNKRKGNGVLLIPKGLYVVGIQVKDNTGKTKRNFVGKPVLYFTDCENFNITGQSGAIIKYADSLRFGAFDPISGGKYESKNNFFDYNYAADLSNCISLTNCKKMKIQSLQCNGNNTKMSLGGNWGDVGRQIAHYGIHIINSKDIVIDKMYIHHFALDGLCISNNGNEIDKIQILNSQFEYNSRQGFSWIGGNSILVKNCKFNYTANHAFGSSPASGVDIEAENGHSCQNGKFINCEFIGNNGLALGADSGPSSDMYFSNCTFIGTVNYSVLINKPRYTFVSCKFSGTVGWGYVTKDSTDATKFINCVFDNKKYKGKDVYGLYLVEIDGRELMYFENCVFNAWKNKLIWYGGKSNNPIEKAKIKNCTFNVYSEDLKMGDFFAVIRNVRLENNIFNYKFPRDKKYFLNEGGNFDLGGNKYIYKVK